MTAMDWVFVAHILLALALALSWLDAPVLLARWTRTHNIRKDGSR